MHACDWEVFSKNKRIGGSSREKSVQRAADVLDGQKLLRFSVQSRTARSLFEFDLGAVLKTRPYDKKSEQWLFYEPHYKVLILRADKCYRHARSDIAAKREKWNAILVG
jgi:hypothetical protein